jgi:tetratricopeptide (TPR) repeat protein
VALFAQTARRVQPAFEGESQRNHIETICRLVEGLPLALELAGSWARYLPTAQIATRLAQDIDFLESRARNVSGRQRSLRAVFDHSWALLIPEEQAALSALSVFRGGFDAVLAESVAGAPLALLMDLIDKTLVMATDDGRFDLHELTRRYSAECLEASGDAQRVADRHMSAMADLAEAFFYSAPANRADYLQRLTVEHDNILAALRRAEATGQIQTALRISNRMFLFWLRRGHWQATNHWHRRLVEVADPVDDEHLCLCLLQLSTFCVLTGDFDAAPDYLRRAVPMARRLEEPYALAVALTSEAMFTEDQAVADEIFERSLAICRDHAHAPVFAAFAGEALRLFGDRLFDLGDYDSAATRFQQSLDQLRAIGDIDTLPYALGNLGRIALRRDDITAAYELIAESTAIARSAHNRGPLADWLFRLGLVQLYRNEPSAAEAALEEAKQLYEEMGNPRSIADIHGALAELALARGDVTRARTHLGLTARFYEQIAEKLSAEMLMFYFSTGDAQDNVGRLVLLAAEEARWRGAATLLGIVTSMQGAGDHFSNLYLVRKMEAARLAVTGVLGTEEMTAAEERGRRMNMAEALAYCLQTVGRGT